MFGKTTKTTLNASFSYRKIGISAFFFQYKSFYIKNPEDFDINWDTPDRPQRPDVENMGYGLDYIYVFNHKKYSLNSSYSFSQKQLKSAGSFLLGAYTSKSTIKGDSSLINSELNNLFNPHIQFQKSAQYILGGSFGYSYNYVFWKDFMINISVVPSLLFSVSDLSYSNSKSNQNHSISPALKFNGMISYAKNKFHISINTQRQNLWVKSGNSTRIDYNFIDFKLLIGYRFEKKKK